MSNIPLLSSRQEQLLRTLINTTKPISYQQLSNHLNVSIRTIQREVSSLKSILKDYRVKVVKKMGFGIMIDGTPEAKQNLNQLILQANTFVVFSPEERQDGILFDLLSATEPIKTYFLSQKYDVTEATISNDLDKLDIICKRFNLTLIRKTGLGVFVSGTKYDKRSALSKLLHKDTTFEEWFELFQLSSEEENTIKGLQLNQSICKRLHRFVPAANIFKVEKAVKEVLENQKEIELSDRNYVNLIVHLLLAIERIKDENNDSHQDNTLLPEVEMLKEFNLGKQIIQKLEKTLEISIPVDELYYITLHLYGANFPQHSESSDRDNLDEIEWYDLTQSLILAVEKELSVSIKEDISLFEGLLSHLVPSINRLKLGLQIHNPMLKEIKQRYPKIFLACQKAGCIISSKVGKEIPEDEIGYLTIHFGASIIRMKESQNNKYKAIIVCASGMGTSTYLASKIKKEIEQLEIHAILSLQELKEEINRKESNFIIISTVTLPFLHPDQYFLVTPFLQDKELNLIKGRLGTLLDKNKEVHKTKHKIDPSSMIASAKYGEAMVQILRNFCLHELDGPNIELQDLTEQLLSNPIINDLEQVYSDLERREKQGHFVIDDLAMVHTKTAGINELLVAVFHINGATNWNGHEIQTILLLTAPIDAPKEHIEMISEISANLIEESFLQILKCKIEEKMKTEMESLLSSAYLAKVKALIKEPLHQ